MVVFMAAVPELARWTTIQFYFKGTSMAFAIGQYNAVEICISTQGESCFPQNDAWVNFRIETQRRITMLELDSMR